MSRLIVARCSFWCEAAAVNRWISSTRRIPLMHRTAYRHSQSSQRSTVKLHRRVVNEHALQEQIDVMKQSVAELETADIFGSLSADCEIDEELRDLAQADRPQAKPARQRPTSLPSGLAREADEQRSLVRSSYPDQRLVADTRQQREPKTPHQSRQPVSKRTDEHRITVPVEASDKADEHLQIYNSFSGKKSPPDIRPDRKNWSEKFGSLSDDVDKFLDKYVSEEKSDAANKNDDECKKFTAIRGFRKKHTPNWYGRCIARFGRAGKVYEALETLEKQMLKEDRVRPNQFVFTVLVGVLGRVGYTEKAFYIFNKMLQYGLAPEAPTYTALFNACSNSPWPDDGLSRANRLRELMAEKDYTPNMLTYNAMIKAYARCGDVKSAFAAADEALAVGHSPNAATYSCLLMACIADQSDGLKLAIETWRLMRRKRCRPNAIHYNLLLRAVRDCGVGGEQYIQQLLLPSDQSVSRRKIQFSSVMERKNSVPRSPPVHVDVQSSDPTKERSGKSQLSSIETDGQLSEANIAAAIPDLLDPRLSVQCGTSLRLPSTASERLMMLGGVSGMLVRMDRDKAKPDIKTFSLLLELMPLSLDAETELLSAMDHYDVQADVDFYNMLIRERNLRKDFAGAREVMSWLPQKNLMPNIQTFGCLAIGCRSKEDAVQLFYDIEVAGLVPNVEVCDILLHQSTMNFIYKLYIMHRMTTHKIRPNVSFIEKLEQDIAYAQKMIVKKEKGEAVPNVFNFQIFEDGFQKFMWQYKSWLLSMELEAEIHPWAKYQQPVPSVERMFDAAEQD